MVCRFCPSMASEMMAPDPPASTVRRPTGLAGQMQKELAAERLLWRKDLEKMQAMCESRIRELEEHHQQVLVERDSRDKLLVSELEEMKVRLARSDERVDMMVHTYMSMASHENTPLSSPPRRPSFASASGGAAALSAQEQLSPALQIPKAFGLSSFAPPPLFTAGPGADARPAPKSPQKSSRSSQ